MSYTKKINIKGGQKSQLALSDMKQKAKMMAYLRGGNPRVHSETNEYNSYNEDPSSDNIDSYRFRVKLLEKIKRPPRSDASMAKRAKPRSVPDENDGTKAEKLEVLNNLLTKKNSLLEQNLVKLKQENKLLKKAAYLVMESKDGPSNEWREQFEESVANITLDSDIFPDIRQNVRSKPQQQRQSARQQSANAENSLTESINQELRERIFELEDQNKKLSRKVRELEDILAKRSTSAPKSSNYNNNHNNHNRSSKNKGSAVYDQDEGRNEGDEDLKTILDEAINKIKTMEYELESFERKNEHLQTELRNQKKMTEFNEKSYVKLQDNQKKLMEENMKLQKGYQNVMKDLEKIRNSGGYTRGSQHL